MFKQLVILALVATVSSQQFEDPTMNMISMAGKEGEGAKESGSGGEKQGEKKGEVKKEEKKGEKGGAKKEEKKGGAKKGEKKVDPKIAKLTPAQKKAAADKKKADAILADTNAFTAIVEGLPNVHFTAPQK